MRILLIFLASLLFLAGTDSGSTSLSKSKPLVGFGQGQLSVRAVDVPLKDLLSEIEEKSGIVIDLRDSNAATKRCSIDFRNLVPTLALREILQDLNFAFFYSERRLARVLILPPADEHPKARIELMNPSHIGQRFLRTKNAPLKAVVTPRLPGKDSKDSDITAQLDVIEAMADSHDPKSIAALGEALTDQNKKVKEAALRVLADKEGPNVMQMLKRGLNDADPDFRIDVLEILADRGDLDSLRKAMEDRNQEVRETAVDLLWNATTNPRDGREKIIPTTKSAKETK